MSIGNINTRRFNNADIQIFQRNCSTSQPTITHYIPQGSILAHMGYAGPISQETYALILKNFSYVNMSGRCHRQTNSTLQSIYNGTHHTKILEQSDDPESTIFAKSGTGFEGLGACNCEPLRPSETANIRNRFEEKVSSNILKQAQTSSKIDIGCFASGSLFEEAATIAYTLMKLSEQGWRGKVDIHIMDFEYEPFIAGKKSKISTAIGDLWHELTHAGHSGITLNLNVFSSFESYAYANCPVDCFIGVDISHGYKVFVENAPKHIKPLGFIASLLKVQQPSGEILPTFKFFEGGKWLTHTFHRIL